MSDITDEDRRQQAIAAELPAIARGLKQLADTHFDAVSFESQLKGLGWRITREDKLLWSVEMVENSDLQDDMCFTLYLNLNEEQKIESGILKLLNWEEFDPDEHEDEAAWAKEVKQFDAKFQAGKEIVESAIGAPARTGQDDDDEERHHWIIWQGKAGLLVFQQCGLDLQFGVEINFYLCPWTEAIPQDLPSPLIDWLASMHSHSGCC